MHLFYDMYISIIHCSIVITIRQCSTSIYIFVLCHITYLSIFPLHLTIISFSNVPSASLHLSGLNVFPAVLNKRSTGADVAGIAKYCTANLARRGKR